ncbi:hypothetical protein O1611_g5681 [Lasiodiplodia mahajangana]|uniref:Uncharacterized protein n=1 Tax=Lasiodiplodia mahajangana TaxID=1108764 RepID=A0ACC2JKB4_9PEZI|nr:hypothetical protein O1611_g5681 [Lasiodiplodia mahajangana]
MPEPPRKRQRRHLNYDKCQFCRKAKKACTPVERVWPQKCERCIELELQCSENSRAAGAPPIIPPQPISQVTEATQIQKLRDLSLRAAWLQRIDTYQNSLQTTAASLSELFTLYTYVRTHRKRTASVSEVIEEEKHSLYADLLSESVSSTNPMIALVAVSLETTVQTFPQNQYGEAPSRESVDSLWKSGDLSTALYVQETMLLENSGREATHADVQKYCDIYSEMVEHLGTITRGNVPAVPPLHNLLTWTGGKISLPLDSTQGHLVLMKDYMGRSLLHVALDLGVNEDIVRSIGFNKALITKDLWGRLPIHIASSGNSEAMVDYFIEKGANLDAKDQEGHSAIVYASAIGNETIVRLLPVHERSTNNDIAISIGYAAKNGHTTVVRLLLERGAMVYMGDVLYKAARSGHIAVVRLLLERVGNASIEVALEGVARTKHIAVFQYLLKKCPDADMKELLFAAAGEGDTAITQLLLDNGASINHQDYDGHTPLSLAAWIGNEDVVQLLLEYGADPNITDNEGLTPLQAAIKNGHRDIAKILETAVCP